MFNLAHFVFMFGFLAGVLFFAGWTLIKLGGWNVLFGIAAALAAFVIAFKMEFLFDKLGIKGD